MTYLKPLRAASALPAILALLLMTSCNKSEKRSISGKILQSCDYQQPLAGVALTLRYSEKSSGLGGAGRRFEYQTTTNEDGIFTFNFEEKAWDLDGGGSYGAELSVEGKLVLLGINSSDKHVGDVIHNFRREIELYAAISTRELNPDDSVFVNQEFIGVGNFSGYTDTIVAQLRNQVYSNHSRVPVFEETRQASISWQVRNDGQVIKNGRDNILVNHECDDTALGFFIIEP